MMKHITYNNEKYVALRIDHGYIEESATAIKVERDKFCVRGQRDTDLNWSMLRKGFETKEEALEYAKYVSNYEISIFDTNGYGIE